MLAAIAGVLPRLDIWFRSQIDQAKGIGTPDRRGTADLDGTLLLLASEAGAYVTGAVIPVDGGHAVTGIGV